LHNIVTATSKIRFQCSSVVNPSMLRTSESFISKQIWEQQFLRTATRHVEYVKHEKIKKTTKFGIVRTGFE
jgi:hypothetical protein